MKKLRKARSQAKSALRGLARTDRSKLTQDQIRHLDARTVQASNAYFETKDAIKRTDPKKGAKWLTQAEVDPGPRPNFASPKPSPPKPPKRKWLHADDEEQSPS